VKLGIPHSGKKTTEEKQEAEKDCMTGNLVIFMIKSMEDKRGMKHAWERREIQTIYINLDLSGRLILKTEFK
jgi:hypothetical protein